MHHAAITAQSIPSMRGHPGLPMDPMPHPLRIVLVEDDMADALLTQRALRDVGLPVEVTRLRRGDELLDLLTNRNHARPDVILLDLGLPGIDGFEILERLASTSYTTRAIPVLVLTGYEGFTYLSQTYPLSMVGYLTKPCCTDDLRNALLKVMKPCCLT